ncbi:MAG: ATP-binding protein [Pseudomonadota bacterium]
MRTIDSTPPLLTLRSLFWLRHCAVLAQLLTMMVAHHWLAYPIPWPTITSILLLTAAFNFYTGWWLKQATPFRGWRLYLQFGFDVLQLAAVLYYTGAAQNPFVSLLLLPIALALLTGNIRLTVSVLALAVLAYLFLLFWPPAFHWHINHDEMMQWHLYGMWINFVVTAIAMAGFGLRLLQQMRLHEQEVRQARERALRDERLVALGTQAAQVAHQLGTPLNTLMLLADELKQPLSAEERQQVLTELDRQISQARNWLLSLRNIGEQEAVAPIGPLIRDTLEQWRWYRPQAALETKLDVLDELRQPVPSSLAPALLNLFNNAYEASQRNGQHRIAVHAARDGGQLLLSIEDAGSGFAGKPFGEKAGAGKRTEGKTSGLGIGIHLANASIERIGGEVSWQALPQGGTRTDIRLPLELP